MVATERFHAQTRVAARLLADPVVFFAPSGRAGDAVRAIRGVPEADRQWVWWTLQGLNL